MSQGKCNLLKPVDSLTGTFFMFSQYTQDLTKQYTQSDKYRCIPSKFAALNLKLTDIDETKLGEIFQNYFENACTFLRSADSDKWSPVSSRTLLFQTLQKFGMMEVTDQKIEDDGTISGISKQLQYIGDINLYSYEELKDGMGYNEIYCYIPNDAKCKDYQLSAPEPQDGHIYPFSYICGYENQTSYNNLSWSVDGYTDKKNGAELVYCVGKHGDELINYSFIPQVIGNHNDSYDEQSNDPVRSDVTEFPVNAILVMYDIVSKNGAEDDQVLFHDIPLGIYFTGKPVDGEMTNTITKYIQSDEVYNQGTSYGLRICSRFLSHPNSVEAVEVAATGSTNISEIAPLLEKMGETLAAVQDVVAQDDKMYNLVKDHLANFKNNTVNVPYVRQVGTKKYWFVNGKNTGAIAQYEMAGVDDIIKAVTETVLESVYTKEQIGTILNNYVSKQDFDISGLATKEYVDAKFDELAQSLKVYLQSE